MNALRIALLLLLVSILYPLFAQRILPHPNDLPVWTSRESIYGGSFIDDQYWQYRFGDEVSLCNEIWYEVFTWTECQVEELVGYYREENLRAWYRLNTDCETEDYLIYDFHLNVRDTFHQVFLSYPNPLAAAYPSIVYFKDTLPDNSIELWMTFPDDRGSIIWRTGLGNFPYYARAIVMVLLAITTYGRNAYG